MKQDMIGINCVKYGFSGRGRWFFHLLVCVMIVWNCGILRAETIPANFRKMVAPLTTLREVRRLMLHHEISSCQVSIEGVVLWINSTRDQIIFQDDTAGVLVRTDVPDPSLQPGEKVRLEGDCLASAAGLASQDLVDNDGIHSKREKSAAVFLAEGLQPVRLEWFNGPTDFELKVDWMGPDFPRQPIPDSALFRKSAEAGQNDTMTPGLEYQCWEGPWQQVSDFVRLPPLKTGIARNFDLGVRTRDTNVALGFSGYIAVPRSGDYTFWVKSDDGAKLNFGHHPLRLEPSGTVTQLVPRRVFPGQVISEEEQGQWVEVEGVVTHVSEAYERTFVEVSSGGERTYLQVTGNGREGLGLLLQGRVRARGISQDASAADGQEAPSILTPSVADIAIVEAVPASWSRIPVASIRTLAGTNFAQAAGALVHVKGTVCANDGGNSAAITDGTGIIRIDSSAGLPSSGAVEAMGWIAREGNNPVLRGACYREAFQKPNGGAENLPLLTKAIQVKRLSRKEAQRGYPVVLQGVITARVTGNFIIQDSTTSIYLLWDPSSSRQLPCVGEYWSIEGKSCLEFAPNVEVHRAAYLKPGLLLEPIHPTGDELVNGSLDCQYIEIQGIATEVVGTNELTLLTREGTVKLLVGDLSSNALNGVEGSLIRVRGICAPQRDKEQRMLALLKLLNASVSVDEPAPARPFDIPLKHASDFLFFDAGADTLRRVKIAGQITFDWQGEYFAQEGGSGFRFDPKTPVTLKRGEMVEVVGFPDMSGPSPVLRQAQVRSMSTLPLPPAQVLSDKNFLNGGLDATLVSIQSRLVGFGADPSDQVLELQAGTRNYFAKLGNRRGLLSDLLPGSLVNVIGVYAGQGGDRRAGRDIDSFELLLNSPADVRVLVRPSWWTFRHTWTVVGGMAFVIAVAVVWITLLRRQVEERSLQLTSEIKRRAEAENRHALEEERARIARDLHDELGATLTEIRFIGAVNSRDPSVPPSARRDFMGVSEKSLQMVSSLDEIVWAVNPANDSVPSLASYLPHMAEEFFRTTKVRCRLDVDQTPPPVALSSEVRHNLCLTVMETLNNIARHSQATEVWLRIHWNDSGLQIAVEDNGCGFTNSDRLPSGNGLANMRRRIEKIGGHFEYESRPGLGTVCRIELPFAPESYANEHRYS